MSESSEERPGLDLSYGKLDLRCSFCDKTQKEVNKLIAGPTVYICDKCISICIDILVEGGVDVGAEKLKDFPLDPHCRICSEETELAVHLCFDCQGALRGLFARRARKGVE